VRSSGTHALRADECLVSNRRADERPKPPPRSTGSDLCRQPHFNEPLLAGIAAKNGPATAWMEAFAKFGTAAASDVARFRIALMDGGGEPSHGGPFRHSIDMLSASRGTAAGRATRRRPCGSRRPHRSTAFFDYLYFTSFRAHYRIQDVQRLPAGHALFDGGRLSVAPWWTPVFVEHPIARSESSRATPANPARIRGSAG
jgi:hypothetical protein